MTELTLLPSSRNGTWEFEGLSRREAQFAFKQFVDAQNGLRVLFATRDPAKRQDPAKASERNAALLQRNFFAVATVVFACMAIESFLNYYGVRRFGPDFRKREIERLSAAKKAALILKHSATAPPAPGDEIFQCLDRLYRRRNELIHPKTHEYVVGVEPPEYESPPLIAQQSVEDMEKFYSEFALLDAEARSHMLV